MIAIHTHLTKLLDPYDLKARLFPALLVLIPAIAFVILTWGSQHPVVVSLSSLLMFCGGPYALASIVRTWGQRAQVRLYKRWEAQPTTLLLRHRDLRLANQTKLRYHDLVRTKLLLTIPSAMEEAEDAASADGAYEAAANALRPLTNNTTKFPLLFKELTAYGYNRNAYGSRWFGLATCLLAALAALGKSGVLSMHRPIVELTRMEDVPLSEGLVLLLSLGFATLWLFHFTPRTVQQAGVSYALRLYEALLVIPKQKNTPPAAAAES
ncbi:hypothetical protein [Burkholderia sp. L27(2015)]|uniref:hypothetical protein n=1 Tax=Burkholderia sp. L27(2015) TaxID=1641858 RepID=UPI00131C76DC|nr:hypothetical protein [Burkholderia sp. L27(2015)]